MRNRIRQYLRGQGRELVAYAFFGALTTIVNYATYVLLTRAAGMRYVAANLIAWAAAVLFAYVTNKIWVFRSRGWGMGQLLRETGTFAAARIFSGMVDVAGLWLLVDFAGVNDLWGKVITNVVVIALNYIFSKRVVFRGNDGA